MTYKSFTTLDELFDLLVARFRIQPPEQLSVSERDEWARFKQQTIQLRFVAPDFIIIFFLIVASVSSTPSSP